MTDKPLLQQLYQAGKPLAEIVFVPAPGQDVPRLAADLDALAPDLMARVGPYHELVVAGQVDRPLRIGGQATREALARLFGWHLRRAQLPYWNPETQQHEGVYADAYYWVEETPPSRWPAGLEGRITRMGLDQPGSADDGGPDTPEYDLAAWGQPSN